MRGTLAERIAARTDRRGPDECWPWLGCHNGDGYGVIRDGDTVTTAHRVVFVLAGGDPSVPVVRHTCDWTGCVNGAHLVGGTRADNSADMVARGRSLAADRHPSAKLTRRRAALIRARAAAGDLQRAIAADLGVAQSTVSYVVTGRTWA